MHSFQFISRDLSFVLQSERKSRKEKNPVENVNEENGKNNKNKTTKGKLKKRINEKTLRYLNKKQTRRNEKWSLSSNAIKVVKTKS